jgi:hypothetical protein
MAVPLRADQAVGIRLFVVTSGYFINGGVVVLDVVQARVFLLNDLDELLHLGGGCDGVGR